MVVYAAMSEQLSPPAFDTPFFKSALSRFATGVTIITTEGLAPEREPWGLTASSFNTLSLDPPLIVWSLDKQARSLPHFLHAPSYVIHVLGAAQEKMAKRFAMGPQAERFHGHTLGRAPGGTLMLEDQGFCAWFECRNVSQHEAGDHYLFIGQVEHCTHSDTAPLIYHASKFALTPR